jgi:hypothetical protein
MAAEIVHDDDVPGLEGRDQHALDTEPEALAVDRTIDEPGRLDAIMPQGGEEGHDLPVAMRSIEAANGLSNSAGAFSSRLHFRQPVGRRHPVSSAVPH